MTGYVRKDTTNNIADGNVINAADLDSEFDGVQAAFNSSTGHTHDGTASEGAPITKLGPVQDVTVSTTVLGVKTTNTVDLGTSSLKFKDFYLAGAASIGGTLGVTGATTLSAALTYGGVTLSNAVTGTGNMVLSASPTITGTITAAAANFSGAVAFNGTTTIGDADTDTITQAASYVTGTQLKSAKTATNTLSLAAYDVDGTAYTNLITLTASNTPTLALTSTGVGTINNMSIGATTASTGAFTTLSASGAVTLSGGTINGVAYLNGSNVLTTGSALTFDGTNFGVTTIKSTTSLNLYAASAYDVNLYTGATNTARLSSNVNGIFTVGDVGSVGGLGTNYGTIGAWGTAGGGYRIYRGTGAGTSIAYLYADGSGVFLTGQENVPMSFSVNGSEAMRIASATGGVGAVGIGYTSLTSVGNNGLAVLGNVGIGTSSPAFKLDVASTQGVFRLTSTSGINPVYLLTSNGGGDFYFGRENSTGSTFGSNTGYASVLYSAGAYPIVFLPNGTERMRLDSSGNLGIGGASTGSKLYITATNPTATFKATTTGYPYASFVNDGGDFYVGRDNLAGGVFGYAYSNVVWGTGAYSTVFATNNQLRMTLDANGNLGLGTSSPSTYVGANGQLVVYGAVGTTFTNNPTNVVLVNNGAIAAGLGCGINFAMNYNGSIVTTYGAISCIRENATSGNEAGALVFGTRTFGGGVNMEKMRLDSSGNLGVGETSPTAKLHIGVASAAVNGTKGVRITNPAGTVVMLECGSGGDSFVGTTSGSDFNIRTNNVTRATFDNSGNFIIQNGSLQVKSTGTTSIDCYPATNSSADFINRNGGGYNFYCGSGLPIRLAVSGAGIVTMSAYGAGTATFNASGVISSSDGRFKTKTRQVENALASVMALQPTYYRWNDDCPFYTEYEELGFIAQEVGAIIPEASPNEEEENKYKNYSDRAVMAVLVKAIQEQQAIIQSLTARITALEGA